MNNKKVYKEQDVWKIISEHVGEDNAISQNDIARLCAHYSYGGSISEREVRRVIRDLRKKGYPILSSPHYPHGGYFMPNNYGEVRRWQERMHIKAIKLLAIVNPVIKSCNDMFPNRGGVEQLSFREVI